MQLLSIENMDILRSSQPAIKLRLKSRSQHQNQNQNYVYYSSVIILIVVFLIVTNEAKGLKEVTCGSILKLINTSFKVRLHSHEIKYGSGSGQQSVTGVETKEDVNSNWAVKGIDKHQCKRGEAINCGSKIRLEHIQTKKNLHSHHFTSPLSAQQEISAFGEDGKEGTGDTGDNWEVVCKGKYWLRDNVVQFRHLDTDVYLSASGNTFGRPINGQMEIVGSSSLDSTTYWQSSEGVFIHPTETMSKSQKDEL